MLHGTIAKQEKNTPFGREFHALSEYIITFSKRFSYSDKTLNKLFERTVAKSPSWESGYENVVNSLDLFFSASVQPKMKCTGWCEISRTFRICHCFSKNIYIPLLLSSEVYRNFELLCNLFPE
jgi:hypothetical protein